MAKAKRMTKDEALREARIGSKLKGGTWYVTRRGDNYGVVPADMYDSGRHGRVVETIDIAAERAAVLSREATVNFYMLFAISSATDETRALYTITRNGSFICAGATIDTALDGIRLVLESFDE